MGHDNEMMNKRNLGRISPRGLQGGKLSSRNKISGSIEIGPTGTPINDIENQNNGKRGRTDKLCEASPTRLQPSIFTDTHPRKGDP